MCTLSHGHEHLVANLQEELLVALRVINHYMVINKFNPISLPITKEMIENVKASRMRYVVS